MQIKRFEATSMLEAVRRVKEELGPDAVVLSSRRVRRAGKWLGLFGRHGIELTAAVDRAPAPPGPQPAQDARPRVPPDPSWRELRVTKALVDPIEAELRELRRVVEGLAQPGPELAELARELRELRRSAASAKPVPRRKRPDTRERIAERLRAAGLSERHIEALAAEASERCAAGAASGPRARARDAAAAQLGAIASEEQALVATLCAHLDARLAPPRPDAAARVDILVGAPGVGKTTSLAKLAARPGPRARRSALVTTDLARLGAAEQLRSLAGLLGVPFDVAASPHELTERIAQLGRRHVFVDTTGLAACDGAALSDLARARALLGKRANVHLVVSATTKSNDLLAELDRFAPLQPDSLIVTRIDASGDLGNVASLLLEPGTPPLSWMGNGQRVPEDLWLPDPGELAARIVTGVV